MPFELIARAVSITYDGGKVNRNNTNLHYIAQNTVMDHTMPAGRLHTDLTLLAMYDIMVHIVKKKNLNHMRCLFSQTLTQQKEHMLKNYIETIALLQQICLPEKHRK